LFDGGKCRIRIYREDGQVPAVMYSQLPDNDNTSVTNMAEYLAAEVIEGYRLPTPLV
jgi:ribosomal protein L25 (general stress protein Ctc)